MWHRIPPQPPTHPVQLWTPDRSQPVRPASDDDEFTPRFTIMEVIPPRCPADAVMQLANWRHRVTTTAPGGTLAEVLQHRPSRVIKNTGGAATEHPPKLWANTLVDSLTARQRLIAHLQARQIADLAELSANYPGIHEFLPTEVALALHVTDATASNHLNDARDLVHRLPATFAALDAGRITAVKANAIRAATDHLGAELSAAV